MITSGPKSRPRRSQCNSMVLAFMSGESTRHEGSIAPFWQGTFHPDRARPRDLPAPERRRAIPVPEPESFRTTMLVLKLPPLLPPPIGRREEDRQGRRLGDSATRAASRPMLYVRVVPDRYNEKHQKVARQSPATATDTRAGTPRRVDTGQPPRGINPNAPGGLGRLFENISTCPLVNGVLPWNCHGCCSGCCDQFRHLLT